MSGADRGGDERAQLAADLRKLTAEWRERAQKYRADADMLLPNRAGGKERESLVWRARAYESCQDELTMALAGVGLSRSAGAPDWIRDLPPDACNAVTRAFEEAEQASFEVTESSAAALVAGAQAFREALLSLAPTSAEAGARPSGEASPSDLSPTLAAEVRNLLDEIGRRDVSAALSETNILWFARRVRELLDGVRPSPAAPDGPWKAKPWISPPVPKNSQMAGWWKVYLSGMHTGNPQPSGAFTNEADAIAVRDALNRVAALGAATEK